MTTTSTGYQLTIGSLDLMENDFGAFKLNLHADEATFGSAATVVSTVDSLMSDGDANSTSRFGNRTATFLLEIQAEDGLDWAAAEAMVEAELDKPNLLSWAVPFAPVTVFEVVRSWSDFVFDDLGEVMARRRVFRLTFECLPFSRSVDPITFTWTGPRQVTDLTSTAGWTAVSGGSLQATTTGFPLLQVIQKTTNGGSITVKRSAVPLDDFLWLVAPTGGALDTTRYLTNVVIGGVSIPDAAIRFENYGSVDAYGAYTVPTSRWRGQTLDVQFDLVATGTGVKPRIAAIFTRGYPGVFVGGDVTPRGVDVVNVLGSARAPVTIQFTAPAGGAFVYTAPDPTYALQTVGAPELEFSHFTVSATNGTTITVGSTSMWFPQGTWSAQIGRLDTLPAILQPNGTIWPQGAVGSSVWSYPADTMAAVSFYDTTGAKTLVSPSPSLPQGYHGGAVAHESHVLHPGRCGFAVLDQNGKPITTTVTYYPRWKHHAGL